MEKKTDIINNKKKKNLRKKIRNYLSLIFIGVSILVVVGIMCVNYRSTYNKSKNDVIELSKNGTSKDVHNIDQFFVQHCEVLLAAAESLEFYLTLGPYEGSKIEELFRNISISYDNSVYKKNTNVEFTGIYASVDGVLYHGLHNRSELSSDYNPLERSWYKEGLNAKGDIAFGEVHPDFYNPDVNVITVSKLLSDGTTVIGMNITMKDLSYATGDISIKISVNGKLNEYGSGFLINEKGKVMVSRHSLITTPSLEYKEDDLNDINHPLNFVYNKIIDNNEENVEGLTQYQLIELEGEECCLFFQKLSNGWYYATITETDAIKSTLIENSKILLYGIYVISIISIIYCVLLSFAFIRSEKMSGNLKEALDLATTDSLTGYSNRTAYDIKVREFESILNSPNDISFAILMMDLNDLKYVNDKNSHKDGDKYICNSCNLVKSIIPSEIYRIGGDEFVMFLTGDLFTNLEAYCNRIKDAIDDANLSLTPNIDSPSIAIGVAVHNVGKQETMENLIRKADAEMYSNKTAIKYSRLEYSENAYSPDLKLKILEKQQLSSELRTGLEKNQFEVWFQPQVNHANNGTLIGSEALVRWRHPTKGLIFPSVFIPLFENNGLIYELDKYVWEHACIAINKWLNEGNNPLPVSVNVSRIDILQPDFLNQILSITKKYNIPNNLLHLEITESAFLDDTGKIINLVNELRNNGFIIAIDDFGSGYSSLSLLRNVNAHIVKLDMRFFSDEQNITRNDCIIQSISRMIKMLGMSVLAEGVETIEQADKLRFLGCAYIQGYLYSKPITYDEFSLYSKNLISEKINHEDKINQSNNDESKEIFHNIISGTNDVVIVADNKTKKLLYANHAAEKYFGKRFDPINPTTCMEYCNHGKLCERCPSNNLKSNEKKEVFSSENGRFIKTQYIQMNWNDSNAFVYYQTDITDQMKELQFSDAIIRNIPGATVAFELNNNKHPQIKFISDNAMKTFESAGIKENIPSYEDCRSLIYPDDRERIQIAAYNLFYEKQPFRESFRINLLNGNVMWIDALVNPVADRNGSYLFYGVYTDITDIKTQQERMDAVLQSIPSAITIYEITENGANRIFISDRAKEVLMIESTIHERKEVVSLYNRVHEEDRERVKEATQKYFKAGEEFSIQFRIVPKEGIVRLLQLDSKPLEIGDKNKTLLFYSIYTDITEQK